MMWSAYKFQNYVINPVWFSSNHDSDEEYRC
jgi:hypothetical protein